VSSSPQQPHVEDRDRGEAGHLTDGSDDSRLVEVVSRIEEEFGSGLLLERDKPCEFAIAVVPALIVFGAAGLVGTRSVDRRPA
jgi:hypothetical protein